MGALVGWSLLGWVYSREILSSLVLPTCVCGSKKLLLFRFSKVLSFTFHSRDAEDRDRPRPCVIVDINVRRDGSMGEHAERTKKGRARSEW